jgi:hypothetical protein
MANLGLVLLYNYGVNYVSLGFLCHTSSQCAIIYMTLLQDLLSLCLGMCEATMQTGSDTSAFAMAD